MPATFTRRTATLLLLSAAAAAPVFAAPATRPKLPSRGVSITNWFEGDGRPPAPAVLDKLRAAGFQTVRLPLDPTRATADFAAQLGAALALLTGKGFAVLLDMHPSGGLDFGADPSGSADRIDAAWQVLAPVVAGTSPDMVFPELLNEPPMPAAAWRPLRRRLAATVRAACPNHALVWGPARVQGIWELDDTGPLADRNAIAAVHYYTPMGFTHQCEDWDESPLRRLHDLPWPATPSSPAVTALRAAFAAAGDQQAAEFLAGEFKGPWSAAHIERDFADLARWSARHATPVMVDEFGVLKSCVDATSRAKWVRAVRRAAEANSVGWTYWELDQGFGLIADRASADGFDPTMLAALFA